MKKILLFLASAALLLVGCTKELQGLGGDVTSMDFSVKVESAKNTRANADGDGAATSVNRCIMEMYYGDVKYKRLEKAMTGNTVTFKDVSVVAGKQYQILFWADCGDNLEDKYYTTETEDDNKGLKAVAVKKDAFIAALKAGKNDELDAFFHSENYTVPQAGGSYTAELTRPFAQINVITTDVGIGNTVSAKNLLPDSISVSYTAANVFNVATGKASGTETFAYKAPVYGKWETVTDKNKELTLSMDYILTTDDKKAMVDVSFQTKNGENVVMNHNLTNLPYQRNYRTNVKGQLLTTSGAWKAEINDDWKLPDEDVNYIEAGSIAAANEALKTNNAVSIENPNDPGTPITIPVEQDGKNVYINIKAEDLTITIKNQDDAKSPANIYVESKLKNDLIINCPNSHVEVNGSEYGTVTATTSATTLVVGKDVTIEKLSIEAGNVVIYGKVAALSRANSVKAEFYASDPTTLVNYINWAKSGEMVSLECNIDLDGTTWNSPELLADFNGNGHVISNIENLDCSPDYAGLFSVSYSTIKNVTIKEATFAYGNTIDARGGALVGDMRSGSIENCHVDGIRFTGYQKVGGLVGFISENDDNHTNISIKNCSVKDATFAACGADDMYLYQTGGLVGYIALGNRNISISNCSVENIKYDNANKGVFNDASDNHGWLSHTFVGTIFTHTNDANNTLAFTSNTISGESENTPLNASIYGSAYFGWARNTEFKPSESVTLGKITIDGKEWTPDYPVKIEGGKGYATLDVALDAATAGQTVQILKAGEYTVQTLNTAAEVVEATVKGVVFKHTPKSGDGQNWVSAQTDNVKTVKNITWNVGNGGHYPYFSNTNLENCTVNGMLCTHRTNKFKNCTFINEEGYNFWVYGNEYTEFDNCTFTCPGKNDDVTGRGSALNCYNEIPQTPTPVLVVNNCTFTAKEASNYYPAIFIKPETAFDIRITDSKCNDNFCTGAISGSKLWNLTSDREGTTVSIDEKMVYPFSMDDQGNYGVSNAFGLRMAIKHWNALKAAGEKSITLADGDYNVSDMAIFQNYDNKSLLIQAENEKQAVITPTTDSKQLIFVVAGMSKSKDPGHITIDGIKFDFSNASNKEIESDVISISDGNGTNLPADEKALYSGAYHYAHNITIENCEIIGLGVNNEHSSVVRTESQNGYNVKVQDCIIDKVGYVLTSKITTYAEVSGCKITNSKCVINNTVNEVEYKITGNTIDTWYNYCIRVDYGPLVVENNTFNITWTPETGEKPTKHEPAVIALKVSTGNEATITKDNTFSKASDKMYDVYCTTSWIVNGETIDAGTGMNL